MSSVIHAGAWSLAPATLPIAAPRMERLPLGSLVDAELRVQTTLVIPPARPLQRNQAMLDRIAQLDVEVARHGNVQSDHFE